MATGSEVRFAAINLIATSRPTECWVARYTAPMAPLPSLPTSV